MTLPLAGLNVAMEWERTMTKLEEWNGPRYIALGRVQRAVFFLAALSLGLSAAQLRSAAAAGVESDGLLGVVPESTPWQTPVWAT